MTATQTRDQVNTRVYAARRAFIAASHIPATAKEPTMDTCRACYDTGATDEAYTPCTKCTRGRAVADVNTVLAFLEPGSLSQAQRDRRACVVCARRLPKTDRPVQLPAGFWGGAWVGACNPVCGANTTPNELTGSMR